MRHRCPSLDPWAYVSLVRGACLAALLLIALLAAMLPSIRGRPVALTAVGGLLSLGGTVMAERKTES